MTSRGAMPRTPKYALSDERQIKKDARKTAPNYFCGAGPQNFNAALFRVTGGTTCMFTGYTPLFIGYTPPYIGHPKMKTIKMSLQRWAGAKTR